MGNQFNSGYAVIIGVGSDLPVTTDDAKAIANLLNDPTRCAYPEEQVKLLTGPGACRKQIISALDWLATSTGPDATAIVYFSGHGLEYPDYHLMPYGYDLSNLAKTAISEEEFTKQIRAIRARKLVIMLDCCHAGGQVEAKGIVKSPLPESTSQNLTNSSGRIVIASSRKDQVSWTGNPYSIFTEAVLEAFAGYGAFEQDGYTRILDIALWVGRKVPERTNDKQHPIIKVSNLEDNFALAWYAAGAKSVRPLYRDTAPIRVPDETSRTQVDTWRRILANYRENLLMIEERMSNFVLSSEIPLQLERNRRNLESKIIEIEHKLSSQLG